ncbi:WD40 repeat domain-containing protein [Herpetosiphon llansteffanensis]|uniref:WD40 repeat domain-containing protein n=1 Tax=Herpetosiphon llansteffanensis TaxID=2094568 RepID=UPI000D7BCB44|nr:WD40 repeat domain-containing protein [Herpetosiphon llansteffanensis]
MSTQKYLLSKIGVIFLVISTIALGACTNESPTENTVIANFDYFIRVFDNKTNHPINNVKVSISISGQATIDQYTDTEGFVRFTLSNSFANNKARLSLIAEGYNLKNIHIDIYRDQLPTEIKLDPIKPAPSPTNTTSTIIITPIVSTSTSTLEPPPSTLTEPPEPTSTLEPHPSTSIEPPVTDVTVSFKYTFTEYTKPIWGLDFSPDDNSLFATSETDRILRWNPISGNLMDEYGLDNKQTVGRGDIVISPDGSLIAVPSAMKGDDSGGIGSIQIYQVADGELIQTFEGFTSFTWTGDFSPDNTIVAGAGNDGTIRLWNTHQPTAITILRGHTGLITRVRFSPDGKKLASLSYDGSLRIWDLTTNQQIQKFTKIQNSFTFAWTSDSQLIIVGTTIEKPQIQILDTNNGSIKASISTDAPPLTVDISPNGYLIAAACSQETICIWTIDTGAKLAEFGSFSPNIIQWNHDGTLLSAGSDSGKIEVWEVITQ